MPLREYIEDSTESRSLLLRCLECRIGGPLCKPDLNLEEFNYKVIAMVGKGTFNNVYCCYQLNTRQTVAIKEIVVRDVVDAPASITHGISVLRELLHDNVVRLLETWSRGNRIYLVYEYLPFNLCSYIRQPRKSKGPDTRKYYMLQILSAVAHYHSLGILHRDLKPQNILIDNIMLKLADFGLASAVGVPHVAFTSEIPRYYGAPELLLGSHLYSTAADMWSVGCIFGEMVTGRALFRGKSRRHQLKKIFRMLGTPTEDSWPGVTAFESIISLSSFPRFEPADLSEKFSGLEPEGLDLLSQMLVLDPAQRISASDAIGHPYFPPFPQPPEAIQMLHTESQGTDSGQGTSGSNSGQGPSGSHSGQGPSGSHSGQVPSGSHSGQGTSGSGASSGQATSDHTSYLTLEVTI